MLRWPHVSNTFAGKNNILVDKKNRGNWVKEQSFGRRKRAHLVIGCSVIPQFNKDMRPRGCWIGSNWLDTDPKRFIGAEIVLGIRSKRTNPKQKKSERWDKCSYQLGDYDLHTKYGVGEKQVWGIMDTYQRTDGNLVCGSKTGRQDLEHKETAGRFRGCTTNRKSRECMIENNKTV